MKKSMRLGWGRRVTLLRFTSFCLFYTAVFTTRSLQQHINSQFYWRMSAAPHPVACPAFFEIGIDSEESLGKSRGASKVQLVDGGIFFLEHNVLKCKKHRMTALLMSKEVWDIDYDDNMLIALKFDGSIVAWKGEVESYSDIEDVASLSKRLFFIPELAMLDTPHLICLRGDVGVVCILSSTSLHLVKIESDLSISLSHCVDIRNKDFPNFTETISDCKIWGRDNLYVAYSVLGSALTLYSIDPLDIEDPLKLCLVHDQEGWVTSLSNGHYPVFACGDSAGTVSFFTSAEQTTRGGNYEDSNTDSGDPHNAAVSSPFSSSVLLLHTAAPFTDSPISITSLLASDENMWWLGTSDGVVYCAHFDARGDGEAPCLTKLKKIRLHCSGWGACALLWEPYTDNNTPGETEWHRINGVLTSVCKDTGLIAQSEVFDFSELICHCCPVAIETRESAGHRKFVQACVSLAQLNLLVVVDESSEVTFWSLQTGVLALELNTEGVAGKIVNVAGYEFLKTDKYLTNFILFLGLLDGGMHACYVSRYETQTIYEFQQSTTVFSVLDLVGTMSRQLPSKVLPRDDDSSLMGAQEHDRDQPEQDGDSVASSVQDDRGGVTQIPDAWEINFSPFAVQFKHPPLPISDIFISSQGQHVCVCYARCCLYVYTIATGTMAFHVDIEHDKICDISKVVIVRDMEGCDESYVGDGSVSDQDSLVLSLLGKTVLKLFDALTGEILTEVNLEEDDYATSVGDTFQFCSVWDLTGVKEYSNSFVGVVVTNNGNTYAFGNETPLVHIHERNSVHDRRSTLDAMDCLPMGVEVFDIWSAFIVVIRFVRSTTVFKFDMRQSFFSVIRSQTFTIEDKKVSIVHAYPLEGDYSRSSPRIMIVLSDGTTCTFNM